MGGRWRRRGALALLAGSVISPAFAAVGPERIEEIRRADELLAGDGKLLRLASIDIPDLPPALEPRARAITERFVAHPELSRRDWNDLDRYDRLLCHLRRPDGADLAEELLAAGLAVVRAGDEPAAALAGLLAAEARGRAAGLGLWGELDLAEVAPEGAFARIGRFALVSGTVVRVVPRSEETYLDFGHDWRRDFGVRITKSLVRQFEEDGMALQTVRDRRVAVRGWPFEASGAMIAIRDTFELSVLP